VLGRSYVKRRVAGRGRLSVGDVPRRRRETRGRSFLEAKYGRKAFHPKKKKEPVLLYCDENKGGHDLTPRHIG